MSPQAFTLAELGRVAGVDRFPHINTIAAWIANGAAPPNRIPALCTDIGVGAIRY